MTQTETTATLLDGRYRLERRLGKSWLAVHAATGSRMVLKPRASFEDPRAIQHLMRLRHPALPRILDQVEVGEPGSAESYLACEYLEGQTFSEWLQKAGGRLTPEEVVPPLAEAARVLAFLHEQNEPPLLHLDLKPEHLIRLPGGHVGLIDFDCARLLPLEPVNRTTIRCTAGYAAPELMTGQPGPECDIYAFGVTMLVLLTGLTFSDNALPPLEPICRHLPPALISIMADCLNSQPERRFASASALACALERLSAQRGLLRQSASGTGSGIAPGIVPGTVSAAFRNSVAAGGTTLAGPSGGSGPSPGPSPGPGPGSFAGDPADGTFINPVAGIFASAPHTTAASPAPPALASPTASPRSPGSPRSPALPTTPDPTGAASPTMTDSSACPTIGSAEQDLLSDRRLSACRDQLVVIWDDAGFAAEFARRLAQAGRETIIIDADLINPRLDLLLALESSAASPEGPADDRIQTSHPGLELALTSLMRQTLPPERFPELLQKTAIRQLQALTGTYQLRDYAFYDGRTLLNLYHLCRMHADAVVISCSRFLHDSFTCLSLLAADLILIPIPAEPPEIREFNRYLDFMAAQYPFDRRKARFVAVDYDPGRQLSWNLADALCGGLLAGCMPPRTMSHSQPGRILQRFRPGTGMADEMEQLLRRLGFILSTNARRPVKTSTDCHMEGSEETSCL